MEEVTDADSNSDEENIETNVRGEEEAVPLNKLLEASNTSADNIRSALVS